MSSPEDAHVPRVNRDFFSTRPVAHSLPERDLSCHCIRQTTNHRQEIPGNIVSKNVSDASIGLNVVILRSQWRKKELLAKSNQRAYGHSTYNINNFGAFRETNLVILSGFVVIQCSCGRSSTGGGNA